MNGLDNILKRLNDQADLEVAEILAQAKTQVDAINADCEAKGKAVIDAMRQSTAQEVESLGQRMESAADMEGRKAILGAKQELVSQVFDQAEHAILNLPEADYVAFLVQSLITAAPNGVGSVVFAKADLATVAPAVISQANEKIGGHFTLSTEERAITGGFVLLDKTLEINATVETLVRLARSQWAGDVAKQLFP